MAVFVGGFAGAHPSGNRVSDVVLSAAAAALVTAAAGFAKRWSWLVLATASVLVAHGMVGWCLGVIALGLVLAAIVFDARSRVLGELVGILSVSALLLDGSSSPARVSALVGIGASGLVVLSAYASAPRGVRRSARRVAAGLGGVVGLFLLLFAVAAASARGSIEDGMDAVDQGINAARIGDRAQTIDALHRANDGLRKARSDTSSVLAMPALALPGLGPNVAALGSAIDEGVRLTDSALTTAIQVDPEALRPRSGQVDLAAVQQTQAPLARVVTALEQAANVLSSIHSPWLVAPVAHRITNVADRIERFLPEARNASDAAANAPSVLGLGSPKRYLVLFVTPVEGRASGFAGNFAELTVSDGHLSLDKFGRTSELLPTPSSPARTISGPEDFLARYSRFGLTRGFQDVGSSPDLPTVARVYRELYPQAGGNAIDGVIKVDPVGLAALLRYTGPIQVASAPEALTADNAADFLLRDQYLTFSATNDQRIDVLDDLGHATFDALTKVDLPSPQQLARDLSPIVDGGHLAFTSFDPSSEQVLERVGLSGAVPPVDGDQIGVTVNDIGGSKIDLFLDRGIDYRATWDPATGSLDATATVTLHNGAPSTGLPDYVIGNVVTQYTPDHEVLPTGTNRAWVSVYSPWFPMATQVDGADTAFEVEDELGRKVASVMVDIPSGATKTLTLHFHGDLPIGEPYHLDVWRQALAIAGQGEVHLRSTKGQHLDQYLSLATNGSVSFGAG